MPLHPHAACQKSMTVTIRNIVFFLSEAFLGDAHSSMATEGIALRLRKPSCDRSSWPLNTSSFTPYFFWQFILACAYTPTRTKLSNSVLYWVASGISIASTGDVEIYEECEGYENYEFDEFHAV